MGWGIVLCIVFLSLVPGSSLPKYRWQDLIAFDKIGHFLCYAAAASCFGKYYFLKNQTTPFLRLGLFLFFLGIILEILQSSLDLGRSFDAFDLLANTAGIICGLLIFQPKQRTYQASHQIKK